MDIGLIEILFVTLIGGLGSLIPIAMLVLLFLVYRKLQHIETLLADKDRRDEV